MSAWGVTGGAGTGKTTRLLARLDERLLSDALGAEQRVLALARYHGARFRLIEKLAKTAARGRADCFTFDRFAWRLCARWRTRLRERDIAIPGERKFDETCAAAGSLLADSDVLQWVAARYPIVVVDEFQDCRGGRLEIVQRLQQAAFVALAADEFQDLDSVDPSPAVAWLHVAAKPEQLTVVRRTKELGLLAAATAIRDGKAAVEGNGFRIVVREGTGRSASFISQTLSGLGESRVAFIVPSRKAPFVREVLEFVASREYGTPPRGPYSIHWEGTVEDDISAYLQERNLSARDDETLIKAEDLLGSQVANRLDRPMRDWLDRQRRICGVDAFPCSVVRAEAQAAAQRLRGVARGGDRRVAMTVHQAKNREFPVVFILWPYQVVKNGEARRRLLYNAITRAQTRAYVIVQGTEQLTEPPFVPDGSGTLTLESGARSRKRPIVAASRRTGQSLRRK